MQLSISPAVVLLLMQLASGSPATVHAASMQVTQAVQLPSLPKLDWTRSSFLQTKQASALFSSAPVRS